MEPRCNYKESPIKSIIKKKKRLGGISNGNSICKSDLSKKSGRSRTKSSKNKLESINAIWKG